MSNDNKNNTKYNGIIGDGYNPKRQDKPVNIQNSNIPKKENNNLGKK